MSDYISNPRPLWNPENTDETSAKRIITLGSNTGGVVIRVSKKGVELNGYYSGLQEPKKYANMRDFLFVAWDDFDKLRADVFRKKPIEKKKVIRDPDLIEEDVSQAYLDTLPKVTLNGQKYYVDVAAKQRRPVDNPKQVFNFENQAQREPT